MNPELPDIKQIGAEALRDLLNNLTQAKAFAIEQAPEFCQQLVARGMWMPGFSAALCAFALSILCAISAFILWRSARGKMDVGDAICACAFSGVPAIFLTIGFVINSHQALSVYIAPKVFLVEEIGRMLK